MMPQDAGYTDPATASPGRILTPTPAPPGLSAGPDAWALLAALRRRWISAVLLGGTLAAIAAVSVYTMLAPGATAYTRVSVGFFDPKIWGSVSPPVDFKTFLQTTAQEVGSRVVTNAALKREEVRKLGLEKMPGDPAQWIEENLKVEFKENSEIVTILFTCPDPAQASVIANAIREGYFESILARRKAQRLDKVTTLTKHYEEKVEGIKRQEENLRRMVVALKDVDPALWREHRNEIITRVGHLNQQLNHLIVEKLKGADALALLEVRIAAMKTRQEKRESGKGEIGPKEPVADSVEEDLIIDANLEADPKAKIIQARLAAAEAIIAERESQGFGGLDFTIRASREMAAKAKKELEGRRAEVAVRVKKARETLKTRPGPAGEPEREDPEIYRAHLKGQVERITVAENDIRKQIDELTKQVATAPRLGDGYDRLTTEIAREKAIATDIYTRKSLEELELRAGDRITKFGEAELMKADTKKQFLATIAAPVAILFAVCGLLAWLECRQQRVRNAGEISRGLGIRVVGAVPRRAGLEKQIVGPGGESGLEGTPVMESIDAIRTRLLHEADTRSTRVVMVTSATMGEGKTTLAAALAASLARAGRKTLLLDGDLRRPSVHQLFEIPEVPGFSEALIGEVELMDAIQDTQLESLSVMPAGQWDREVLGALSRGGLEGMFDRLAEEFDFILIDSHPVLEAADALLIGRQADAVILSVLSEVSQMPRVYAAQQQLAAVGIRLMGAVVNAANPEDALTATPVAGAVG